jgi:hypothetical protein
MILNLKDPTILSISITLEVHEINCNSVSRALRGDWLDRRFFNCLGREVTNRAPRNNPLDILKSNTIIPFKDPFVCLLNACF